jgi:hypothetical protein
MRYPRIIVRISGWPANLLPIDRTWREEESLVELWLFSLGEEIILSNVLG